MRVIDVSVVILNFNTKDDLQKCIEHVLQTNQQKICYEVIVVDNASRDGSAAMVRTRFPQVTLLASRVNLFFNKGFNLGMKRARGEYILIIEPDVFLKPHTLTKMVNFMKKYPSCGASTCKQIDSLGYEHFATHYYPSIVSIFRETPLGHFFRKMHFFDDLNPLPSQHKKEYRLKVVPGSFIFARSSALKSVEYYDEDFDLYFSDVDLSKRLRQKGWDLYFNGQTHVVHYGAQSTNKMPSAYIMQIAHKDKVHYYQKHFGTIWSMVVDMYSQIQLFILKRSSQKLSIKSGQSKT